MSDAIYYRSVSLKNVRCFGHEQTLYFTKNNKPDGEVSMWNVILGKNGVGKTTVLREMVSFLDRKDTEYPLIAKNPKNNAGVDLCFQGLIAQKKVLFSVVIKDQDYGSSNGESYSWFPSVPNFRDKIESFKVFAYGANRKMKVSTGAIGDGATTSTRVVNLFNENHLLTNVLDWLLQVDYLSLKDPKYKQQLDTVKKVIIELLKTQVKDIEITVAKRVPKIYFTTHYGHVELEGLSLGFKTLMAWITEFVRGLIESYPDSMNPLAEPAVCLIDEIDLHMHPSMQRLVVKFLRETFPQTQFIVTAHSPLIIQSEEATNVILLRRKGDEVEAVNDVDYVNSWRVDQILESDLFGVGPYGDITQQKLKERRNIILKEKPTTTDKRRLKILEDDLKIVPISQSAEVLKANEIIKKHASKL